MVQQLPRPTANLSQSGDFPVTAPAANPVFYRTYSRKQEAGRESWSQVADRTVAGITTLGNLTPGESALISRMQREVKSLTSGRWLWIGGTDWIAQAKNFSGAYNCTSTNVVDWRAFGLMMDLAMMGCGTGAMLEPRYLDRLPAIRNALTVTLRGALGVLPAIERQELTQVSFDGNQVTIAVGDSRHGWVASYQTLLELSSDSRFDGPVSVIVDLSNVRPAGEALQGFGGIANPVRLPDLYQRCATILNRAIGRQLTSVECCLLIDEAAVTIVAGNVRRCLPENALVHTEAGLVPIAKVRIGDRVLTSQGFYPVTNFFDQGEQSLCRIKTEDGYFECTPDHKVAVFTDVYGNYEMVKTKELKADDRLVFVPTALPGTATELPEYRTIESSGCKPVKQISVPALTSDVAYFIGYLHGDGSVSSDGHRVRFRIHEDDKEVLEKLIQVSREFGLETHTLRDPESCKTKAYELQLNSKALNVYLSQFKQPFTSLVIPDCILLGTADIRKAYLSGLADADGCHSQGVLVASVHSDFLRQVRALYASLGITLRLCHSIRKRNDKWEGELVSIGKAAFESLEGMLSQYSLKFSEKKRPRPSSFKDHGFAKSMVKPIVKSTQYHWGSCHHQMIVPTLKRYVPDATDLVPIRVVSVEMDVRTAHTYDIEVATRHEFMCEGILVSNSAGMRQFDSGDEAAAIAKDNLWQQDAEGNWRIDPERDSLRMANHTRVFHHKPSQQDCLDAVTKQFYSGEGAIQYAPEAIARSNADLLTTPDLKREFLTIYTEKGRDAAQAWLLTQKSAMSPEEVEHRLQRYALNPCITADSWVHTESGARQVKDLVGQQHGTYINGELFSTTAEGFFESGVKDVVKLTTKEGYSLRLTGNHRLLKVTAQTQQAQYTDWVETAELQPGDRVLIHNHRGLQPWAGAGTAAEGWLLGSLIGDGCFAVSEKNYLYQANLRFWGDTKVEMKEHALALANGLSSAAPKSLIGTYHDRNQYFQVSSSPLAKLAKQFGVVQGHKTVTPAIEAASHDFYCGFLRGLFDADGSVQDTQAKGISVRLSQSNAPLLEAVQRMLLRVGISSAIYRNRRPEQVRLLPDADRNPAEYACKAQHELVISNDNLPVFLETIGFQEPQKQAALSQLLGGYKRNLNRDRFAVTVAEITPDGTEMVYDCTVPGIARFDANGFVAHNCGEILGADFHCVAGETFLIAKDGLHQIKDVVGQPIEIWNGESWSEVTPMVTGRDRQLYRVQFGDGTFLDVTDQHRFFVADRFSTAYQELTTADLRDRMATHPYPLHTEPFAIDYQGGDYIDPTWAYTLGQLVGDGSLCQSHGKPQLQLRLYGEKSYRELTLAGRTSGTQRYYAANKELPCLLYTGFHNDFDPEMVRSLKYSAEAFDPIASWSRESILNFVAGLADADGSAVASGGIRLYLSDYDRAYRVYLLLLKCGVRSSVNLAQKAGTVTNLGQRSKDLWYLQITDCAAIPCQRLETHLGHTPMTKGKWQVVRSITELPGVQDTYCFNEPIHHKGVFGGTLTGQCNLAEVHLNRLDPNDLEDQAAAFKAGALSVAALLNHQFQEDRYRQSREWDPIVGVSFTGLFDFFVHAFGLPWLDWWTAGRPDTVEGLEFKRKEAEYLDRWRELVHETVWDYCDRHGLRRPNRCTTTQPAGCLDRTAIRIFDQGLLYADELIEPGSGETDDLDLTVRGGIASDKAIANQPLNLVRVTLRNGRILRMTPNHRLSVDGAWVRADCLTPEMTIDHSLGEYHNAQDALLLGLNPLEYSRESRQNELGHGRGVLTQEVVTPTVMTPDLGYFLGCLFGDGAMSEGKHRIRFAFNAKELDLVDRLQVIAQRLFGLTGAIHYDSRNDNSRGELVFASKQLFDWLNLNGLGKTSSKTLDRIPQAVRRSSRDTILAFFCGLIDTDGCVRETGTMSIDSASEAFIRNLQQIGEAVGLCFAVFHNDQGANLQAEKNMWGLSLSRMVSDPESLDYLNVHSRKCGLRPLLEPKRIVAFHPYQVATIEAETVPDYSYDFAVAGQDDDDSWYWQGALKSHNTKSLLTGASPGWHPPKAARFLRRITFRKNDPVALACLDFGYSVIPSQSDKDDNGNLLDDPFDPRCTEWLVEIPTEVSWASIPGADQVDISRFSALAQFDFYMQVQRHYTRHNTSATIEFREAEIQGLADRIYETIDNDEGYISAALLARFDDLQTFPRLPFEPIDQETYTRLRSEVAARQKTSDFFAALQQYDSGLLVEAGPAGCDSDKCMLPEKKGS